MQFAMNLFCSILIVVTRSDLSTLHYFHTNMLQLYHTFILVFLSSCDATISLKYLF